MVKSIENIEDTKDIKNIKGIKGIENIKSIEIKGINSKLNNFYIIFKTFYLSI
jgi:hypothetical protein